jgi:hypothetical protein
MDEVLVCIRGKLHYLCRSVNKDGHVLDILLQSRRNAKAAKRFFRKLLKSLQYAPRVIVTDKLRSYAPATREILPGVEHRQSVFGSMSPELRLQRNTRTCPAATLSLPVKLTMPTLPQPLVKCIAQSIA